MVTGLRKHREQSSALSVLHMGCGIAETGVEVCSSGWPGLVMFNWTGRSYGGEPSEWGDLTLRKEFNGAIA